MKKIILCALLTGFISVTYAGTIYKCPSVDELNSKLPDPLHPNYTSNDWSTPWHVTMGTPSAKGYKVINRQGVAIPTKEEPSIDMMCNYKVEVNQGPVKETTLMLSRTDAKGPFKFTTQQPNSYACNDTSESACTFVEDK